MEPALLGSKHISDTEDIPTLLLLPIQGACRFSRYGEVPIPAYHSRALPAAATLRNQALSAQLAFPPVQPIAVFSMFCPNRRMVLSLRPAPSHSKRDPLSPPNT